MQKMPPDQWKQVFELLDTALDLPPHQRASWLETLDATHSYLRPALRELLTRHATQETNDFLQALPQFTHVDAPPTSDQARALKVDDQVGPNRLLRELGRGGMGEVWLAARNDGRFEGNCAIKFLRGSAVQPSLADRFRREGSLLARLTHPNIARLLDAGATEDGTPYLALEYIDGERIDRYCESKNLPVEERVRLFVDVVAAVAHAHTHLIIHRDLKPSNVLVTSDGSVKLLDFGIAKLMSVELAGEEPAVTRIEDVALTPEYAAPEQILGDMPSTATDVYQLGMLLYVLLTGRHPLQHIGTRAEKLRAALDGIVPRASDIADERTRRDLHGDVDAILGTALRKNPIDRYPTAQALKEDLVRYLNHEPVLARRGAALYRLRKFVGRHRLAVAGSTLAVLSLCAALAFAMIQAQEAQQQRDRARLEAKSAEADRRFVELMMSEVGEPGKPITLEQVLDKGLQVLETQYGDDPDFVVRTLIGMSGRFMDMGDRQREYAALTKAEAIARQHGNLSGLAKVQCSTVETEIALGHVDRAIARLAEGRSTLARATPVKIDDELDCLRASATLSNAQGRVRDSIRDLAQAVTLYEKHGMTSNIGYPPVLEQLGGMYASLGDIRRAYEYQHKGRVATEQSGRRGTLGWSASMHNEALNLWNMGELRVAFDAETQVVNGQLARSPSADPAPAVSLLYARMLTRLDKTVEAFRWIDRGQASAARAGDHDRSVIAHVTRAEALLSLHQFDEAATELNIVSDAARGDAAPVRGAVTRAQLVRAQLLAARGQLSDARKLIDSVLVQTRDPELGLALYLDDALLVASRIATAQGRYAEAESHASEALKIDESRARDAAQSADVGEAALRLGETKLPLNDRSGALVFANRAVTSLSNSLGADHSLTRAALTFDSELRR